MEVCEGDSPFSSVLTTEELQSIPTEVRKKVSSFVTEKFDELITNNALLETTKFNTEKELLELREKCNELDNDKSKLSREATASSETIAELEKNLSNSVAEILKLQKTCNQFEIETTEFRHQRNMAIDEKDEALKMVERRNAELERCKMELEDLTKRLENAVAAKCEAQAKSDEVSSMKMSIEYREKQIVQERTLLNEQIQILSEDLRKRTEELLNMRRDNTSKCIQLETKLSEKTQELIVANDSVKMLTELNTNLTNKVQELTMKMQAEKDTFNNTQEAMEKEMEAQVRLVELYKQVSEEKMEYSETLTKAIEELKTMLKEAVEKYGDLESKCKEQELLHNEMMVKKNECIAVLKKELETSNEILKNLQSDNFEKEIEGISPTAAAASKFIKSGMSLTQIYAQYITVADELTNEKEENAKLKSYMDQVLQEIQDKAPLLIKQREELEKALETVSELTKRNDNLINENQLLTEEHTVCKRVEENKDREILRLKGENVDLSRQVCRLLQEIQVSRTGSSTTSSDQDIGDSMNSADIISKRLVTFNDICELQSLNQRLLATVRELSSKQEEAESLDPAAIANLTEKLNSLREENAELLEQQERHGKMLHQITAQRDMYKTLYTQAMKGSGEDMSFEPSFARDITSESSKLGDVLEVHDDDKLQNLQLELEKTKKDIERIKEESDTYRNEKLANEKLLVEQLEKMRSEVQELTKQNTKLSAKCESNDEMFKISKNNIEIYKQQIEKLEERNKIYSESIVKHETCISYLKDQVLEAQTKLSRAEVLLGSLQKENALLRDSESRLVKERELMKTEMHSSTLLHTNIELIKATLERNDAESKLRLEGQLMEAHRECAALRRRLQEELDRFRQLTSHLEKQTQNAQTRMEEEKQQADKLRKELIELREDYGEKTKQIQDLSKKLKTAMLMGADNNSDMQRFKEMEKMLNDSQAEIQALQNKLKTSKEAAQQYCNIAEGAEKRVMEVIEQQKQFEAKYESKIKDQQGYIAKLEEQCSELQGELSVMNDGHGAHYSMNLQLRNLQDKNSNLVRELENAKTELDAARNEIKTLSENLEAAETKYTREMMLHSNDLQALTSHKEELTKVISEINDVKNERDCALQSLEESKLGWKGQEELFIKEKKELEERFKNMESQNALLLDQLQALNTQMSVMQTQVTDSQNVSLGDASLNRSLTEDDVKSSDQLVKIIKYLRQEKDMAINKCEVLEAELLRLKSAQNMLKNQLQEVTSKLENDRQKSEMTVVASAKHAEVLRKVETLNAITDSNRSLRVERDNLLSQVNDLKTRVTTLEEQIVPLQEKNHELSKKAEAMQTENITLREDGKRWRQRANILIEKSNRTSPEDWKKLQTERENLAKQLTIERGITSKLTDELNTTKENKARLEEQLRQVKQQQVAQKDELNHLTEELGALRGQLSILTQDLEQAREIQTKQTEENNNLKEELTSRNNSLNDLKNNLAQVRKIAKKYKTQYEDQTKEIETLKQEIAAKANEEILTDESKEQLRQEGRSELEQRISQLEETHNEKIGQLNQQITQAADENENFKKENEALKQSLCDKEGRFKVLFKNAKDRIVFLTEENNMLKSQVQGTSQSSDNQEDMPKTNVDANIERLEKEKQDIYSEKQQEKERFTAEIEALTQKVTQLQRQLGAQQGSKPSTSSGTTEKSTTEPPTANIKPMAGHSTNTQTQSVQIQPWRSSGEPPLASIRPMSVQVRTLAVPPTSQSPSAVVPPQQQVHTTGSSNNNAEAISSSPSSSHTDYAPATSSASSGTHSSKQISIPPTQSTQDTEDDDTTMQVQATPQQQAVALVLPRVEPPSGSSQEQSTSSGGSSNTVTTTQAGLKRPREADTDSNQMEDPGKLQQQQKRSRLQHGNTETFQSVSESGLEVEYQVPTSSQRDHEEETDAVIVVESDEEGEPDEGEGADDEPDDPDTEGYDMESMSYQEQEIQYDDADCPDEEDEGDNEVEVIEDSSEVPNQSERSEQEGVHQEESNEQAQSEAISSGTDGASGVTVSQASTSQSSTMLSLTRTRPIAPLSRPQQTPLLFPHGLDEGGDDGIVPSTPTLSVPRRSDGFGEAVSSPQVPIGTFTFNETVLPSNIGSTEIIPEQTLEVANLDDNSTGRSVPTTPLQASPQEAGPSGEEQNQPTEADIPMIMVSGEDSEQAPEGSTGECMGPPAVAGTSSESQPTEQGEDVVEGEDEVSSEGEKPPTTEEGVEEGREAEASPSTNIKPKTPIREQQHITRRSIRQSSKIATKPVPTPIVWTSDQQQRHNRQDGGPHRGRGSMAQGSFTPRGGRRGRTRSQRPYTRF